MEEITSYIESGILELYVLGDLSAEERAGVEAMALKYPEIKTELSEIENAMENVADAYSAETSETSKAKFLTAIGFNETINDLNDKSVIPLNSSRLNFYKYGFAASFALLILSLVALFSIYNNLKDSKSQIVALQNANQKFANQVNILDAEVKETNATIGIFTNPDYQLVKLAGTDNSPESKLMVMWNKKEEKVMIDLKLSSLPDNDENHQYQLWALVDGKPVDLGVFDANNSQTGLKSMKSIGLAQAFAVTLEPKGGSVNPTMNQMMVMGVI